MIHSLEEATKEGFGAKQGRERTKGSDRVMKYVFLVCSIFSILAVVAIVLFLLVSSIPAFREVGIIKFLFGMVWDPVNSGNPQFGIFPMIVGSIYITVGAIVLGGTMGVFGAIYLAKFCPKKLKGIFTQFVSLLAGIPSVVYGLFGMKIILPALKFLSPTGQGEGLLAGSILLAMMILPTVLSISKTNIEAVPESYYDGAVALGCTHSQAVFKTVVPAAKSGIVTSIILGIGRAIGETMAIILVVGNKAQIPGGLFDYFRTLTVNIVFEMGYADYGSTHRNALIATGFVLLVFVLIINVCFNLFKSKGKGRGKDVAVIRESRVGTNGVPVFRARTLFSKIMKSLSYVFFYLGIALLLFLIVFILAKGLPYLSLDFLFGKNTSRHVSLMPSFVSTFWLIVITLLIAIPIGVFAAIFLVEYTKRGSKLVGAIRTFTETLAGIPSIVFGLFGMIVFVPLTGNKFSLLAGALTLALIVLPTVVRSTEEAILSVPDALREGSLALGASKVRTIFKVVLPCAISGIMTSIILSIGRIVGESAALIFTAGAVSGMPDSPLSPGSSLAVKLYTLMSEGLHIDQAYATAVVLLIIVVILNLAAYLAERKLKKKY